VSNTDISISLSIYKYICIAHLFKYSSACITNSHDALIELIPNGSGERSRCRAPLLGSGEPPPVSSSGEGPTRRHPAVFLGSGDPPAVLSLPPCEILQGAARAIPEGGPAAAPPGAIPQGGAPVVVPEGGARPCERGARGGEGHPSPSWGLKGDSAWLNGDASEDFSVV